MDVDVVSVAQSHGIARAEAGRVCHHLGKETGALGNGFKGDRDEYDASTTKPSLDWYVSAPAAFFTPTVE